MPTLETKLDVERRDKVARKLSRILELDIRPTPHRTAFNYKVYKDAKLVGVMSIKWRKVGSKDFKEFFFSARKWSSILAKAKKLGVQAWLVVRYADGICAHCNMKRALKYSWVIPGSGRTKKYRGVWGDIEDMRAIPVSRLRVLYGNN